MTNLSKLIKHQIVSEKSTALAKESKYLFAASLRATKRELAAAVEQIFDVQVKKVNVLRGKGKTRKRPRSRRKVKRPDWKKAIVTLKEGEKLEILKLKSKK